ncbi:hypothetical protein CDIK_2351 [Cucumispora dikerogammari]|nr:hypothetical protein CDIK_2351 [Cucumispora dikerogammari]
MIGPCKIFNSDNDGEITSDSVREFFKQLKIDDIRIPRITHRAKGCSKDSTKPLNFVTENFWEAVASDTSTNYQKYHINTTLRNTKPLKLPHLCCFLCTSF